MTEKKGSSSGAICATTSRAILIVNAYRSFEKKRYHHIFWINAAAETLMISSFVEIAKQLEIAKQFPPFFVRDDRNHTELIAAVKRWLEECQRRWLLIFDNVEAEDFSLVQTYFPQRGDGSILLTTRAHSVSSLGASSIEVEKMEVLEGTKLLLRLVERFEQAFHTLDEVRDDEKTRVVIDEALATTIDEATNLVLVLDCFPLALEQAGAYIEETECSLTEYRRLYQTHRQTLLARKRRRKPNATDYPASVATTWSLSFQKVEQANPAAAELLCLCAFLAPDEIPEELITESAAHWTRLLQEAASDADARKSSTRGQFGKAEDLFLRALAIQEEHLGNNHLDTASTLHQLAILYMGQGRYTEAEPFFLRSLHIREQAWGPEDLRLIEPLNAITIIYTLREKYAEAEEFVQRRDRLEELKNREEGIRPLATGVLAEDVWRSSLQYLKNRPD
jgi:tetratricopeptide (TPR) repeat protein